MMTHYLVQCKAIGFYRWFDDCATAKSCLAQMTKKYPMFVVELYKNTTIDWEDSSDEN